jgi:hypothetical protein
LNWQEVATEERLTGTRVQAAGQGAGYARLSTGLPRLISMAQAAAETVHTLMLSLRLMMEEVLVVS